VTYLRLGKVFSSVITGNLALLGVAAGQQNLSLAENGGLARWLRSRRPDRGNDRRDAG
jgi:uncharacterized membrane protein YoaK (UPF0700 family)